MYNIYLLSSNGLKMFIFSHPRDLKGNWISVIILFSTVFNLYLNCFLPINAKYTLHTCYYFLREVFLHFFLFSIIFYSNNYQKLHSYIFYTSNNKPRNYFTICSIFKFFKNVFYYHYQNTGNSLDF